jgi:ATP phosphoribosyltransferase
VADILSTEAVLIGNPNAEHKDLVEMMKRRIDGYLTATKYVMIMYNVSNEDLAKVLQITPGKRSPTVTTLDDGGKAVSSLVLKGDLARKMDELHAAGATDILSVALANTRM